MTNDSARAVSADLLAARRLADETRRLIGVLVATQAPADALAQAADEVAAAANLLVPHASTSRYDRTTAASFGDPGTEVLLEDHPFLGPANPLAPPLVLDTDGVSGATVTYDLRHEGHRGFVHGGVLAAAFDLVLALSASRATGRAGWTGTLTVRYLKPTPLHTPLHFSAEPGPVRGRTVKVVGRVADGDTVTAEAEALYVLRRETAEPDQPKPDQPKPDQPKPDQEDAS